MHNLLINKPPTLCRSLVIVNNSSRLWHWGRKGMNGQCYNQRLTASVIYKRASKPKLMKKQQPLEIRPSLTDPSKNSTPKSLACKPISPHNHYKPKSASSAIVNKRANVNDPHSLNLSTDRQCISIKLSSSPPSLITNRKKFRNSCVNGGGSHLQASSCKRSANRILIQNPAAPGSIAAARRGQVNLLQLQRKKRISCYGRTPPKARAGKVVPEEPETPTSQTANQEHNKCNFITPTSDPIYVRYHDEEWGVPVHDDKLLFELLVLAGFLVGMDWTTILKMRNDFREAFDGFDAELIANFTEKRIASVSNQLRMDVNRVRTVIDNSKRVIEIKDEFGSLDKYVWGFLNYKAMCPEYRSCRKIPVKTSKSESISKNMVRRKLRSVGPTVIHSFMQAAGLTNDHLLACPRHAHCLSVSAINPETASPQQ